MTERCLAKWYPNSMMTVAIMASAIFMATLVSSDSTMVKMVERRSNRDTYWTTNTSFMVCQQDEELTYLVVENECVNNEELTTGMHDDRSSSVVYN